MSQQHRDRDPDGTLRFHMTQDGRQMTANDFDSWLAQKGLRVAGGQVLWNHQAGAGLHRPGAVAGGSGAIAGATFSGGAGAMPIPTAPARTQVQYDSNGHLTGYNSERSGGGGTTGYSSYSGGSGSGRVGVLTSYDSGRD